MDSDFFNLEQLQRHAEQSAEAREHLLCQRFDPHLQQPLFGKNMLPKFSGRAVGCRIWDSLGRSFIDWSGHAESNLLGYRHQVVVQAIQNWASGSPGDDSNQPATCDGPFTDPREVSIAEKLSSAFRRQDGEQALRVGLTRGRHEALYSATEIARTLLQRPIVVVAEQHSQRSLHAEDQRFRFLQSHFEASNLLRFTMGDLPRLSWLFQQHPDQIAAVLIAPPPFASVNLEFSERLPELLQHNGALLIVDDSQTSFRDHWPGEQSRLALSADITVFGENLAGPFAFSVMVGRDDLLGRAWQSTIRTVDRPAGLTLDVVEATLDEVISLNTPSQLQHIGLQLQEEFNDWAQSESLPCRLVGQATRMALEFESHPLLQAEQMRSAFCALVLEQGVVTHGEFWPNAAHDGAALHETIGALRRAGEAFLKWIDGVAQAGSADQGPFPKHQVRGRIGGLHMNRKTLMISGWIMINNQPVELSAINEQGQRIAAEPVRRDDLAKSMPQLEQAADAGFQFSLEVESTKKTSRFLIEAHRDSQLLYRTLLVHDPTKQTSGPYLFDDHYLLT